MQGAGGPLMLGDRPAIDPRYPLTLFYAFQEETAAGAAVGWEVILESMIAAGLQITGTWPLRTEHAQRLRTIGSNTLASTIVLVCRPRPAEAPTIGRREFSTRLRQELASALPALSEGGVSPADLAQAAIGPGMAVFTAAARVLDADGPMAVGSALRLIQEAVQSRLTAQTAAADPLTGFCLAWAELHGLQPGPYGEADVLARARSVGLDALRGDGCAAVRGGTVRLLRPEEQGEPLGPARSAWALLQRMLRALETGGEPSAAAVARGAAAADADLRALAHRLYGLFDGRGEPHQAARYDALADALPRILALAARPGRD